MVVCGLVGQKIFLQTVWFAVGTHLELSIPLSKSPMAGPSSLTPCPPAADDDDVSWVGDESDDEGDAVLPDPRRLDPEEDKDEDADGDADSDEEDRYDVEYDPSADLVRVLKVADHLDVDWEERLPHNQLVQYTFDSGFITGQVEEDVLFCNMLG